MENEFAPTVTALMRAGKQAEAFEQAQRFVGHYPESARAHSTLAHVLMAMGQLDAADEAAAAAARLAEDEPAFHFLHARTRFALSDYGYAFTEAVACAQRSVTAGDPYYLQSCALLAAACMVELGHFEEASKMLSQVDDNCTVRAPGRVLTRASVADQASGLVFGQHAG